MPKLLLVEDNEMNRDMLSRRLTKKGFEVVMAVDGKQVLDMVTSEVPDDLNYSRGTIIDGYPVNCWRIGSFHTSYFAGRRPLEVIL